MPLLLTKGVAFWTVCTTAWLTQLFGMICIGYFIIYLASNYLKYKFGEINRDIRIAIKLRINSLLIQAINQHNLVAIMTYKFNIHYKYILFAVYYFGTPAIEILLYLAFAKGTTKTVLPFVFAFLFIITFGVVFVVNYLSTRVSSSAHKSIHILYSHMNCKTLSLRHRLRVLVFISRLDKHLIGFSIHDLFRMSSLEFALYVYVVVSNYMLILNFVN